jgi:biopolymer transport protein TolR
MKPGNAMRTSRHKSPKLFADINTLQFASVMGIVVFVLLLVLMTDTSSYHHGASVDLPKVLRPVSMPNALREDVMRVSVTRDGKVYFGSDHVDAATLQQKIAERLKDQSIERKVYVSADMRARWGTVKLVLDSIRSAGILRIAFLVNQRKS